ncbi:MAG TPA: EF-hand domain-containing protein [Burkholderiales bacterium]|jgi:Ca2+-binding EF-hand superfamily protein|nr:EF-hand domain-containing protein [Burkholderiales bacterium]
MFALSRLEWLAFAAALLLCPGGSPLGAGPPANTDATAPSSTARSLFDRLDRNRDGYLNAAELATEEAKRGNWIAIDRDRDGRIGRGEFGLVGASEPASSAAAGGTRAPKKPE